MSWHHSEHDCCITKTLQAPYVPIKAHARYKYVLHLDGVTASSREGMLIWMNSLLLKQRSPWLVW